MRVGANSLTGITQQLSHAKRPACLFVVRVMIAFNNVRALEQQVVYLAQQLDSQDKARKAYGDQFDRNQRTLLDLLDSQNELFDTQRAMVSAQTDLVKAQSDCTC